jgi:NDP-mannose synthase
MKAVILAGGKGRRLLPYTTNFPKPLMPVGEKPILEIVIEQLKRYGLNDISIATGHLEELIRVFFQTGEKFGVKIRYFKEDEPLGTAGPLNLMRDEIKGTFLLMNGDILTDLDFSRLIEYHKRQRSSATVALTKRTVNIDFGVVRVDEHGAFAEWQEKPNINYLVSTGIYVLEPQALDAMPKSGFFNLPDLILNLHNLNHRVFGYIHEGYWLDIGRAEDYESACKDYSNVCLR